MTSNGSFFAEIGAAQLLITDFQALVDEANTASAAAVAANAAIQASVNAASASATSASTSAAAAANDLTLLGTHETNAATSATNAATSATASASSATSAASSATAAATSATNAGTSASAAATSATAASGSATTASTQATNASTSATAAASSATAAASSATAAAASATAAATSATNTAAILALPNILTNPFMEIDQANEGNTVSTAGAYVVDGWTISQTGSAVFSAQRVADGPLAFPNSIKATVSTGASVGATNFLMFEQRIEANEIAETAFGNASAQSVALTFYVKSSIASYVMSAAIRNAAATRSYVTNFTVSSANTWEKKTVVIPGDTGGTWVTSGAVEGLRLSIVAAAGSNFQGTAGSWTAGNIIGTSSNTNTILSTNGATFQVSAVKLEVSTSATGYAKRPHSEEIIRCRRQYRKSYTPGIKPGTAVTAGTGNLTAAGAASSQISVLWSGENMRSTPTLTYYDNAGTAAKISYFTASWNNAGAASVSSVSTAGIMELDAAFSSAIKINFDAVLDARL